MEKGTLIFNKKKGGGYSVSIKTSDGKLILSNIHLQSNEYEGKQCEFERVTGTLVKVSVEGEVIYAKQGVVTPGDSGIDVGGASKHPVHNFNDSLKLSESAVPRFLKGIGINDIDNFSLKFNKVPRMINSNDEKFYFFKNDFQEARNGRPASGHQFFIKPNYGSFSFSDLAKRQKTILKSLFTHGNHQVFEVVPDWRLVCGLSGGIYETNMTLHHVYGFPFIPASSLKGVVRSWVIKHVFGGGAPDEGENYPLVNAEFRALTQNKFFCHLFGAPAKVEKVKFENGEPLIIADNPGVFVTEKNIPCAIQNEIKGKLLFFDGLPICPPKLMPDIMNVHYPKWYNSSNKPPTDDQSPNPIYFLTVSSESRFQVAVGSKYAGPIKDWDDYQVIADAVGLTGEASLSTLAKALTLRALSDEGIGAKTSVGYGYLSGK